MLIRYPRGFDHLPGGFPARRVLCSSRRRPETKNPACFHMPGFQFWRRPTLARPIAVLPSGLQRFTSVFGMGTGGAIALFVTRERSRTGGFAAFAATQARGRISGDSGD